MFDASLRPILETPLHWLAGGCIAVGLTANGLTILGFVFGVFCAVFVAMGFFVAALVCLILNRLCDGLDGAVARRSGSSDFGGYLDIVCDFLFYAMVPFAFVIFSQQNAVAAGFLMFSFVGTGSSFLAYAILEAKNLDALARKAQERASQKKSFLFGWAYRKGRNHRDICIDAGISRLVHNIGVGLWQSVPDYNRVADTCRFYRFQRVRKITTYDS